MVSGILHETGTIASRFLISTLLGVMLAATASASPLFTGDSVIDIALSGPLGSIARDKKDDERVEYPFVLNVDNTDIPVLVRVRGKSRTVVCDFPPLRLNFSKTGAEQTIFSGQDKLKLVTHCRGKKERSENNTLEEYTAYRIFNLLSEAGYRVRLLRISYQDTDGRLKNLDRPYYGFLIESDAELAARLGAEIVEIPGLPYSRLNVGQTALLYVFQYLLGNVDWSFVTADGATSCCHNVDLLSMDEQLYPIPYDFDFSGFVNARYAKPAAEVGTRRVTTRVYRGYCKIPIERIAEALDEIVARRDEIMALVENSPTTGDEDTQARVRYIDEFFEEVANNRRKLLADFESDCVGLN